MAELSAQERIALINQNLQEVLKPEILEDVIVKQGRPLIVYWGWYIFQSLLDRLYLTQTVDQPIHEQC
jgi:hypothetical protein